MIPSAIVVIAALVGGAIWIASLIWKNRKLEETVDSLREENTNLRIQNSNLANPRGIRE